jgi:hypothetical protein
MAEWEDALKFRLIEAAKSEIAVGQARVAAINAETLVTAGTAARERYGQMCTDLENAIQRIVNLRAEMAAAGCTAASLAYLDSLITSGQTVATEKRAIYTANDFIVTLRAK